MPQRNRPCGAEALSRILKRNLGFSLYDQYWLCPSGEPLRWRDLNFFRNDFSEDWGDWFCEGESEIFAPDSEEAAWAKQRWKIVNGKRLLFKGGSGPFFQEPTNELIAARLCERWGIRHIPYRISQGIGGRPYSVCENYVTEDTEFISAWQMKNFVRRRLGEDEFSHYARACESRGIRNIRGELSRMLVVDYLLANEDRHWHNFGLVRRADDLFYAEAFPLFDMGESLWHNKALPEIRNEEIIGQMLRCPLEDHLVHVSDTSFISFAALIGFPEETEFLLSSQARVGPERAARIAACLRERIGLLDRVLAGGTCANAAGLLRDAGAHYRVGYNRDRSD